MGVTGILALNDEVIELIFARFQLPFCGERCLEVSTNTICGVCHKACTACTDARLWRDSRALVALSSTNKRLRKLAAPYLARHQNEAEAVFSLLSSLYLPQGCIRRGLNLPLRYTLNKNSAHVNRRSIHLPCRWNYLGKGRALGTLLHYAVEFNNVSAISILVKNGAEPSIPDSHAWTPLHIAAAKGSLECARSLLVHGADPNLRGGCDEAVSRGWSALHLAAAQADVDMVALLLSFGADAGCRSGRFNDTPLHELACNGRDIACFPGSLRPKSAAHARQAFEQLVRVTADGPGGLRCTNTQGATPSSKATKSTQGLFQSPVAASAAER